MTEPITKASSRPNARIAGFFYLCVFLTGTIAIYITGRIVVSGDAAATAANILSHKELFRLGFAADLLSSVAYVAVTALFCNLFKPVNKSISLLAAFFSLVGCSIGALSCLFELAPFVVLGDAPYLRAFSAAQLQTLALISLKLHDRCINVGLVFFGFYCLLIGYLIFKSTFLPRALGVGMVLAGFGWLTFLSPSLANYLFPYNMAPGILGEGALTLWLLVMGVNIQRWNVLAGPEHA